MTDLMNMTVEEIWMDIEKLMKDNPQPYKDLNVVYQFDLSGEDGGVFQLVFSNETVRVLREDFEEPSCTLQMKVSDFKKFLQGKMNSTAAFMMGKIKVQGSVGLALKLEGLLGQYEF
ncbi:SCP2 sterol-binding domain-containing protein [Heyndrickxia vini]|uniref:SCP2 sterol-binding domain-containing protein n=1 Tax=Heyndrickxia vini TaxID=1476025 RepID=A0ABX7E3A8_9BACI|nr:SCP2 sterol-binding domain-containing protein [Heyndrickxia vini]QQZ09770.1 SCP2 sterol-binding domain-containing protein [Heyndrickxia vini]